MPDERCNIAVGHRVRYLRVDQVRKPGNAAFEESVGDVHDTGLVLKNGDLWSLFHLADGIKQAIGWHPSVRVDDEDIVAHTDVPIGPSEPLILRDHVRHGILICGGFVFLRP